jgi:hypothetical protein
VDLLKLRPSDGSAAAIRRALADAETAQITVVAELDKARQARDELLLDGTPADLSRAEKTLTAAIDMAERVGAMVAQLRSRLAAAERAEAIAFVESARKEAEARSSALGEWWSTRGPAIFGELQRGLELLAAAETAGGQWRTQATRADQAGHGPFAQPADHAGLANSWLHAVADGCLQGNFADLCQRR